MTDEAIIEAGAFPLLVSARKIDIHVRVSAYSTQFGRVVSRTL